MSRCAISASRGHTRQPNSEAGPPAAAPGAASGTRAQEGPRSEDPGLFADKFDSERCALMATLGFHAGVAALTWIEDIVAKGKPRVRTPRR